MNKPSRLSRALFFLLIDCICAAPLSYAEDQLPPQQRCIESMTDGLNDAVEGTVIAIGDKQWHFAGSYRKGQSYSAQVQSGLGLAQLKFQIDPANQQIVMQNRVAHVPALQFMGQSWSKPTLTYVNWQGQRTLVMVVGGGFDATGRVNCIDPRFNDQGYACPNYDPKIAVGAGIYMFDAFKGDLLWWSSVNANQTLGAQSATWHRDLKYSVVSQINSIDRDGDGLSDAFYFADLGGQVFRVDLNNQENDPAKLVQRVVRILDVHQAQGLSPRFYRMPSFSVHIDPREQQRYGMIALSSGNASSVMIEGASLSAQDGIFVVYDKDIVRSDLYGSRQLESTEIPLQKLTPLNADMTMNGPVSMSTTSHWGWWYPFSSRAEDAGTIKGLGDVLVIDHRLFAHVYHKAEQASQSVTDPCGEQGDAIIGTASKALKGRVQGQSYLYQLCLPEANCLEDKISGEVVKRIALGTAVVRNGFVLEQQNNQSWLKLGLSPMAAQSRCDVDSNSDRLECLQFKFKLRMKTLRWFEQWLE